MFTKAFGLLLLIDGSMNYELNIGDFVNIMQKAKQNYEFNLINSYTNFNNSQIVKYISTADIFQRLCSMGHTAAPPITLKHVCLMIFYSAFAKNSNSIEFTYNYNESHSLYL